MITNLKEIDILTRRLIEASIIQPFIEDLYKEIGKERSHQILKTTIENLAEKHGRESAINCGGNTLKDFANVLEMFSKKGENEKNVLELNDDTYNFDMTKCKYAEMYRELGLPELGLMLSCTRDFAFCKGFNPKIQLTRTQTIMEGAQYCDFRFKLIETENKDDQKINQSTNDLPNM